MVRFLNHIRMRNKMLLMYFLCVFAPMIVTNAIFFDIITDNVRNQRLNDMDRAIEQIKNEFRSQLDDAVGLSSFFYTNYTTNEILDRDFANSEEYVEAYNDDLRRVLSSYNIVSLPLQKITIYADNPTLLHSGNIGYLSSGVRNEDWYKAVMNTKRSQPLFVRTVTPDGRFDCFSLIRRMDYFDDRMFKEKLLKIDFKTIDLNETFANLNMQGEIYLVNPKGEIEYTTNKNMDWRSSDKTAYTVHQSGQSVKFDKPYKGISYLEGWRIIGTVDEDEVVKEVRRSRDFILWSGFLMIMIPTAIILVVARSINVRVVQILKHMKKVKSQSFAVIEAADSRDEIGQLTLEFNQMIMQIQSLIDDVYLAEIQKKSLELQRRTAQLNALQSQINPHFLFNALETIRMRSKLKRENETATIIHHMAKIFRSSLIWNKDRISVKEELDFILCFLEIQRYRFEDKMTYRIDVEPDAYACELPKMIFVPFVENAVLHGVESLREDGRIGIRISLADNYLVFSVSDNGIGMTSEQVGKLYRYLEMDDIIGDRIGVQNVIYRAKLLYGDRFRFQVDSGLNSGTTVTLYIPTEIEQDI